mmetsp:Transcript_102327/g.330093  ORF Transcript_102327/g.330093 Transcript_102327/m.330093 type:complete len:146 (-) Transcript_102327:48-485(-)
MLDLFFLTTLVFDLARPLWMSIADFTYWVLDVLLSFRAGYQKHGKLEMRPKSIARRYVKTWFVPDVVLLGVVCSSMYFVTAGVGTYMHTSNLFSRFSLGMRTTSMGHPAVQNLSRDLSTKATAVPEGTSLSEAALWVRFGLGLMG